ncbi:FCD domain-containing protein, partial [Cloacibacillus evryensis]
ETHSNQTEPNTEFHLYLAQITGNPILLEQLINTIEKLQRLSWMGTPHKFTPASVDEHREIVKLIRTKQVAEAQALMRKHINQVFEIAVSKTLKKVF